MAVLAEYIPKRKKTAKRLRREIETPKGLVVVGGPIPPEEIKELSMNDGLRAFRPPDRQHQALIDIATMEKGLIFAAIHEQEIVGYVTFHPPDKFERWGKVYIPSLIELGGIEVSGDWRGAGLARTILEVSFANDRFAENIVVATEYCWHWDLKGTGLPIFKYRQMMEKLFSAVGLFPLGTDDPDICAHPANMLTVRVGSKVDSEDFIAFETLRYQGKTMF